MKKVIPVVLAAMLAIGFSAFTPSKNADTFYRLVPGGALIPTSVEPCTNPGAEDCVKMIPEIGQQRTLYHLDGTPYKWNGVSQ